MEGNDTDLLEEYANRFAVVMETIENVSKVETDTELSRREMQIKVNEAHADNVGVSATSIAQTVFMALGGVRLPYLKQGEREIPVWAQLREEDRKSRENLDNVTVTNAQGNQIPISQLVNYTRSQSPQSIHRVNGKNVVTLSAKVGTDNLSKIRQDLRAAADNFELPVGYSFALGDELQNVDDNFFNFLSTLLMAILLIYLVMSALFESFLFPLSILTSVPMALGGAMWMLYFTNGQLDTITFIGCVLMSGLIVNNGIVIVDHINSLRKTTPNLKEAIVQAGKDRFRPVCMTAITTILGLLPLAVATSGSAVTFAGLGRALVGGLAAGTLLTLFIVPIFYSLLEDLQRWTVNILGNISGLRSPHARQEEKGSSTN
jgi:HAE1 family hydrophobic/amphiphilic exporter-1